MSSCVVQSGVELPYQAVRYQIADAIDDVLKPRGVGVVIEAVHLCMMMRGVEQQNSSTITSALRGQFRDCPMTRDEFLRLAHRD